MGKVSPGGNQGLRIMCDATKERFLREDSHPWEQKSEQAVRVWRERRAGGGDALHVDLGEVTGCVKEGESIHLYTEALCFLLSVNYALTFKSLSVRTLQNS